MSDTALKFLRKNEWSMGNGQCDTCKGCSPRRGFSSRFVGHEHRCKAAKAIESLGGKAEWKRPNRSRRYKQTIKFFAPVEAKFIAAIKADIDKILMAVLKKERE